MQNKLWITPELIVLVRSKHEEAVLAFCKDNSKNVTIAGPMRVSNLGCEDNYTVCAHCLTRTPS